MRDAEENKKFFDIFEISVDHNCHEDTETRKKAYGSQIIYGILGNFQRDYLLTKFFDENFMSGHHFDNVLVDEVDSMLLDKGNNILYLSSSLPDIDELEGIFVDIWRHVNQSSNDPEEAMSLLNSSVARKIILDSIYGILDEDDIKNMKPGIKNSNLIINKLKNAGIIDDECALFNEPYDESTFSRALKDFDSDVTEKIKYSCRTKMEGRKSVKIPEYLKNFVRLHLNNWIDSAVRAMFLKNQSEYIVDTSQEGQKLYKDPNIIILDLDTGTDMSNSQWDEGLHQFLQLKHGCKLSLLSLKSVFISNVTYFKKYKKLYGMTGTLGNLEERKKTTEIHQIDFATLPRYREQKFQEYPSILVKDPNVWLQKITEEVIQRFAENRSVLIICETIQDTKAIKKSLQNSTAISSTNVIVYQRDNEEFNIEEFKPKLVIVATNLASRGTDIKLSNELREAGGLHVILAYLPQNARIENQAFGRASRAGDMGSGRLIICTESATTNDITKLKETRNHNELQRLDEVNSYYKNFIMIEEDFFGKFHTAFKELRLYRNKNLECLQYLTRDFVNGYRGFKDPMGTEATKIYLENFKLQWSFWLDENSKKLEKRRAAKHDMKDIRKEIDESFSTFILKSPEMHPVKQIELFKFYVNKKEFNKSREALSIDFQHDSIAFHYLNCYNILKNHQIKNGYKKRKLENNEERALLECLNMINNRIKDRNYRVEVVDMIKKQYNKSLVMITGYNQQQKLLNEIDEIFIDSIQSLLGRTVTHDILVTPEIKLDIIKKEILKELDDKNIITKIRVNQHFTTDDIRIISLNHGLKFDELKSFLNKMKSQNIKSMRKFENDLKHAFQMPSREEFWDILLEKNILTDEIQYVIIDMSILQNVDPSIYEGIQCKFKNEELTVMSSNELVFADVDNIGNDKTQFVMELLAFKIQISTERFNFLMDNDIIALNKRAIFNIEKYEQHKIEKIFNNFDDIKSHDLEGICSNHDEIFKILTKKHENGRQILVQRGDSYALNVENIDMLEVTSEQSIFGEYEIYQTEIFNLIAKKFAYRVALESLVRTIIDGKKDLQKSKIQLHINPHLGVINDLVEHNILILPKANKEQFKIIKSIGQSLKYKFLDSSREIRSNILGIAPVGSVFTDEKMIKFIKENIEEAIKDFENIERKIKESLQVLFKDEIELPDVVLKPLEECFTNDKQHEMLDLLKLKGFDLVIKVELKKYSGTYWFRFSMIILIALGQIILGAAIMVLSKGLFYKVGQMLIQEGLGDAIFALGTLRSGHFSWKDYGKHKMYSVITTLSFSAASAGLSRIKCLKKFFQSGKKIHDHIIENIEDKSKSIWQLIRSGGELGRGTTKEVFILFSKEVGSNIGKAITQASIGMSADYLLENYTNQVTEKVSQFLIDKMQSSFWEHDICDTVKSLLQYYSPSDLKEKILKAFGEISDKNQFWANICDKVSGKVDELIQTGQNISKLLTVPATLISKIMELSFVSGFVLSIFYNLNNKLSDILKEKRSKKQKNAEVNEELAKKFNQDILNYIKAESSQKLKNAINSSITKPFVTYLANGVVNKCTQSLKGLIEKHQEKGYVKNASELIEIAGQRKLTENEIKRANKIISKSKDPNIHAALVELNIPMNYIALKASAIVLKNLTNKDISLSTEYEGQCFLCHECENPDAENIKLKLANGHIENSKNSPGNNCVYDSITDIIPNLRTAVSPEEFRKYVAHVMRSDPRVIKEIKNSSKKRFYMNISFYGGRVDPRSKIEHVRAMHTTAGPYNQVKYHARKKNIKSGQADHFPPDSTYPDKNENFEITIKNKNEKVLRKKYSKHILCSINVPKIFHEMCMTTGRGRNQTLFRGEQANSMKNNKKHEAVEKSLINYLEVAPEYYRVIFNIDNAQENYIESKIQKAIKREKPDNIEVFREQIRSSITEQIRNEKIDFKLKSDFKSFLGNFKELTFAGVDIQTKHTFGRDVKKPLINADQNSEIKEKLQNKYLEQLDKNSNLDNDNVTNN